MDNNTYRARVLETESRPAALNFGPATLLIALNMAVAASNVVDHIKRAIYYGKDADQQAATNDLMVLMSTAAAVKFAFETGRYRDPRDIDFYRDKLEPSVAQHLSAEGVDLRLLHAALGKFTESGEFVQALIPTLMGASVDRVNLAEEIGDSGWYEEIAMDALGLTREQVNDANIKKLQDKKAGRYKKGEFLADDAVNRDTQAERAVLEGTVA
ncbi:hypothetical protein [Burkholderia vietnamiensis]|uniref:hypothetical protein n=1 Tax=Burkholderia vietnamiensis TaxID=60552 RepID=UPI001CADDA88|nr:hypothetical protein [Burkholderia vietnamiensis]CAG9229227.1 conserved hypothetical protein [Burkholderia vietnamiensis]HDR9086298.1 hypothetical protein [Burkholderia vietnamiensis]